MIATGSEEYARRVSEELSRACEELKAIHEGDVRYLAWLQEIDEARYRELTEFSDGIRRAIGMFPLPVIQALIDFYVASHRVYFACWESKGQFGLEILGRLISSASPWKM